MIEREDCLDDLLGLKKSCGGKGTVDVVEITATEPDSGAFGDARVYVGYETLSGETEYDNHMLPEAWSPEHPLVALVEYLDLDDETCLEDVDTSVPVRFTGEGKALGIDYDGMQEDLTGFRGYER